MYTEYWVSASNVIMSQNETNVLTNEAKSSEGDNQISTVKKKKKKCCAGEVHGTKRPQ